MTAAFAVDVATEDEFEPHTITITVYDWKVDTVEKKIRLFNRKAAKLGCPGAEIVSIEDAPRYDKDGIIPMVKFTVNYFIAKHSGKWNILGSAEPSGADDDTVILNLKPGVPGDFSDFRHHDMSCDHCGRKRKRKKVVLVEDNETKEIYSVGTSCLLSFTGIDPKYALLWEELEGFSVSASEDEDAPRGYKVEHMRTVRSVAKVAAAIAIVDGGWAKADRNVGEEGSGGKVMEFIFGSGSSHHLEIKRIEELRTKYAPTEEHIAAAEKAIESFKEVDLASEENEFVAKVATIVKAGAVRPRHIKILSAGIALSIVCAKAKVEKAAAAAANPRLDEHFGVVGKRIEFDARIKRNTYLGPGMYGDRYVIAGSDSEGREWCWFTTSGDGFKAGDGVRIRATVKDHKNDPKWGKSTVLNRVAKV